MAEDISELLSKLEGRSVTLFGKNITLRTEDVTAVDFESDWKIRFYGRKGSIILRTRGSTLEVVSQGEALKYRFEEGNNIFMIELF